MTPDSFTLSGTSLCSNAIKNVYHGKVRDVYDLGDKILMVSSDRISAFDHVLPRAIPYKGQVLNQIAQHFLLATQDIVPNWLTDCPDPNVSVGWKAVPFKIEMVIRGYLAGHAWRTYKSGIRTLCGVTMPDGMKENDKFPQPIITPTTKADEGHDMDIAVKDIIDQGIISKENWKILEEYTTNLFAKGSKMAEERGLLLVDTKYEFGRVGEAIMLIDEIHTPDSSRYFIKENYKQNQQNSIPQVQLSKEFVREWLIANGFQGLDGQKIPDMSDEFVWEISNRYIQLFELITGRSFEKAEVEDIPNRIQSNIKAWL